MSTTLDDVGDRRPPRGAMIVLATLATIAALYLGHAFLVPVCLALVLTALLTPVVGWLMRHHVPAPAGAALTVLASLGLLIGTVVALEPPMRSLIIQIPSSIAAARTRLVQFEGPLARIGIRLQPQRSGPRRAPSSAPAPAVQPAGAADTATPPSDSGTRAAAPGAPGPSVPKSGSRSAESGASGSTGASGTSGSAPAGVLAAVERTFGVTAELLSELVEVLLLAFFLLGGGRAWGEKLAQAVTDDGVRHATLRTVIEVRGAVARYVLVTALINLGQGTVVALVMWGLGIPSPLLWGVLTFILEFVPYLGGFVMVALLLIAGLAGGGGVLHALLAPLSYLAITSLQNNLVSPAAYGRGLRLNPAAVLVAVMFWYAMWGVAGAFLAVPILAAARILTTHVPALAPVGAFLED